MHFLYKAPGVLHQFREVQSPAFLDDAVGLQLRHQLISARWLLQQMLSVVPAVASGPRPAAQQPLHKKHPRARGGLLSALCCRRCRRGAVAAAKAAVTACKQATRDAARLVKSVAKKAKKHRRD